MQAVLKLRCVESKMKRYATLNKYNIDYEPFMQEFFISSKHDNRPQIGGFKVAADAIDFAEKRVKVDNERV